MLLLPDGVERQAAHVPRLKVISIGRIVIEDNNPYV
jgi:hypothetical protein